MRIRQCFSALSSFRRPFFKKYGLAGYRNANEPAIFFGVYKPQWRRILGHKGLLVMVWAGTDILQVTKNQHMIDHLKARKNTFHIAISRYIAVDLDNIGLPYRRLPITPFVPDLGPVPIGNKIYAYLPPQFPAIYGKHIVDRLQVKMPYLKFIISDFNKMERNILIRKIYPQCFLGLRLTKHDGLSNTVMELGLMGRKVIWNGGTPHTISWNNEKELVRVIKDAYKKRKTWDVNNISKDVKAYLTMDDSWLHTEYYTTSKVSPKQTAPTMIKKTPTVTVIINTVNENPRYLLEAIKSYESQVGVLVQIIISTIVGDPSVKVAGERGHKIVVSPKPGIYPQLNTAIKHIKADWYCYASGNDVAHPRKLILEVGECLKYSKKVCYSAFYITDNNLTVTGTRTFYSYSYKKHLNIGNFVSDCAMMSREIIDKYGPFAFRWGNAAYYDLWLRVYEGEGNVFCYNPVPTWYYRICHNSQHVVRGKNKSKKQANNALKAKMLVHRRAIAKKKGIK